MFSYACDISISIQVRPIISDQGRSDSKILKFFFSKATERTEAYIYMESL